jgi:hypothetical protein
VSWNHVEITADADLDKSVGVLAEMEDPELAETCVQLLKG